MKTTSGKKSRTRTFNAALTMNSENNQIYQPPFNFPIGKQGLRISSNDKNHLSNVY